MIQPMQDLPQGARFIGPNGSEYKVVTPASEHPRGFVEAWNLSMSDAEVLAQFDAAARDGHHPREGFFSYSHPTDVEVLP